MLTKPTQPYLFPPLENKSFGTLQSTLLYTHKGSLRAGWWTFSLLAVSFIKTAPSSPPTSCYHILQFT